MALGILDLSIITETLVNLITGCLDESRIWDPAGGNVPFAVKITGEPPDLIVEEGDCVLSVYLFHVVPDKFQRNAPVTGPFTPPPPGAPGRTASRVPAIPFQPLSLDLYYLLTAHSDAGAGAYAREQQVMSMALKCFHENPIVSLTTAPDSPQFTLTMEMETADELGRLWQAVSSPLRLSALYKVSVVFMEPPTPPDLAKQVDILTVSVDPSRLPFPPETEHLLGTFATIAYTAPRDTPPGTQAARFDLFPATVAPEQSFLLHGVNLKTAPPAARDRVFLLRPAPATPLEITSWVDWSQSTPSRLRLTVPTAGLPAPGIYPLTVGTGTFRSNAVPISIAARVDPSGGPTLPTAAAYTISGVGFVPGQTEVLLDTVALRSGSGTPGSGEFVATTTSLSFKPPTGLRSGRYAVRVRVNHVESPPALWIRIP